MPTQAAYPVAFQESHAEGRSLLDLRHQAESCERCDLYRNATQTVFGEGDAQAKVMLVGEQPGDKEDIAGRPFVGPAGTILDECLAAAGVDRSLCYVTNTVKHFKFEQRGKRRLHAKPNAGEIQRCAWWLGGEIDVLKPELIVALGATALQSLLGSSIGLKKERGRTLDSPSGLPVLITIHPSYLLRIRDREEAQLNKRLFIEDLKQISTVVSV
ncbi:UdgX family uracil-DNA binding protein [Rhizobium sp. RAF56]|uniref:UdgX family uracil-DNA binding protein n=1 Tax=Rhizobium sp. RAF56 TaxID=3233062 RepID=UPI003F9A9733